MAVLWDYSTAPGAAADPPTRWPVAADIHPASDRATLVLLAHPHCPCTRASIGELARLMARLSGRMRAYVLFATPPDVAPGWERTDLWDRAAEIPDVVAVRDAGGVEAARFGALTSGQTVVYDADGRLLFSGGITPGRGHAGDSVAHRSIIARVAGPGAIGPDACAGAAARLAPASDPPPSRAPVFGCALGEDEPGAPDV